MNITEFIEALGNVTHKTEVRKWLKSGGLYGKTCPLTCVCSSLTKANYNFDDYLKAAAKLGISKYNAYKIAASADNHGERCVRSLRNKMLVAVGLPKE